MHPNNIYKALYPEGLKSVSHLNLPTYVKHMGMYAAVFAIGERNGLYEDLVTSFGPRSANLIMDYATYSIITKSNVVGDFETEMAEKCSFWARRTVIPGSMISSTILSMTISCRRSRMPE